MNKYTLEAGSLVHVDGVPFELVNTTEVWGENEPARTDVNTLTKADAASTEGQAAEGSTSEGGENSGSQEASA